MLTFEKVLEIFKDYLALDTELEVCKSRYGYIRVEFNEIGGHPRLLQRRGLSDAGRTV